MFHLDVNCFNFRQFSAYSLIPVFSGTFLRKKPFFPTLFYRLCRTNDRNRFLFFCQVILIDFIVNELLWFPFQTSFLLLFSEFVFSFHEQAAFALLSPGLRHSVPFFSAFPTAEVVWLCRDGHNQADSLSLLLRPYQLKRLCQPLLIFKRKRDGWPDPSRRKRI